MDRPIFILGLGAQKAGTTWLHAYLDHFDRSDFGEIKEYHVWDGLTVPAGRKYDVRHTRKSAKRWVRHTVASLTGKARDPFYVRRGFQRNPDSYFDYFADLLSRDGITMTGDITPAYSGLSTEAQKRIREGFDKRGIATRAVFLMREPIERCLSAIAMYQRAGNQTEGVDPTLSTDEALLKYIDSDAGQMRSRYDLTLSSLDAAFAPSDRFVAAYERFFTEPEFLRLNEFFALPPNRDFLDRKFNAGRSAQAISPDVRDMAMQKLEPVYRTCFARDPSLRNLWAAADAMFPAP